MTVDQALAAAYQLTQHIRLEPSSGSKGKFSADVGLRHVYDCTQCDDAQKKERGGCPLLKDAKPARDPHYIDTTGDETHDHLYVCPRGLTVRSPALTSTVNTFVEGQQMGRAAEVYGGPLVRHPKRWRNAFAVLSAAEKRLALEIRKTRQRVDGGG